MWDETSGEVAAEVCCGNNVLAKGILESYARTEVCATFTLFRSKTEPTKVSGKEEPQPQNGSGKADRPKTDTRAATAMSAATVSKECFHVIFETKIDESTWNNPTLMKFTLSSIASRLSNPKMEDIVCLLQYMKRDTNLESTSYSWTYEHWLMSITAEYGELSAGPWYVQSRTTMMLVEEANLTDLQTVTLRLKSEGDEAAKLSVLISAGGKLSVDFRTPPP
eukprot:GHVS01083766.1.p1 GENE.GHVS01083766.1~~GHVS01083766.1.p1  ORF type:complete len:222 (+),score=20.19 GHVS01083766.1:603-1268(+)